VSPSVLAPCRTCGAALALRPAQRTDSKQGGLRFDRTHCASCGAQAELQLAGLNAQGGLHACLACGHPELYTRKRFPRWLGFSIVGLAALAAPATHYLSLAGAALLDALLYVACPDELCCYRCACVQRGFAREPRHPRFDREIDERLRYGERAVMGKPMRAGGTAGAPEPEH
jgi:hypothetical protein